jgi:hypothetical protein
MGLRKIILIAAGLALSCQAGHAVELSPWMGSADQTPFQLDPITMVAVTYAGADPMQTGSTGAVLCRPQGCAAVQKPAMASVAAGRAPQN